MENNEHIKSTDNIFSIYKQCSLLTLKDSKASAYTTEKTLRIVAVTLKLVSFLDIGNAMRTDIEKTALGLLKDAASLAHSDRARRSFESDAVTLSALLTSASLAGILSNKNVSVLNEEIVMLITTLANIGTLTGRVYMEQNAFSVDLPQDIFIDETKVSTASHKGHSMDMNRAGRTAVATSRSEYASETHGATESNRQARYVDRVQEVQKDRRATILGLLQKKDRITVKDVSNIIRDCSEKTLQRELAALVTQGVLKKEGERRWSTYSLI